MAMDQNGWRTWGWTMAVVVGTACHAPSQPAAAETGRLVPLTSLGECYRLQQEPGAEIIEHRCTASIGVTLFDAQDSETGIFRQADAAMYQAKTTGRNRYCLAEEPILEP